VNQPFVRLEFWSGVAILTDMRFSFSFCLLAFLAVSVGESR